MKVEVVASMGGLVSFSSSKVKVLKSFYDEVPEDKRSEFDAKLIEACEKYYATVSEQKKQGIKPAPLKIKKVIIDEIVTPFIKELGISKPVVKSVSKEHKETKKKDPVVVEQAKPEDVELAKKYYDNNISEEILDDSKEYKEVQVKKELPRVDSVADFLDI